MIRPTAKAIFVSAGGILLMNALSESGNPLMIRSKGRVTLSSAVLSDAPVSRGGAEPPPSVTVGFSLDLKEFSIPTGMRIGSAVEGLRPSCREPVFVLNHLM